MPLRLRLHPVALACALLAAASAPALAAADDADPVIPTVTVTGSNDKAAYTVRDSSSATRFDLSLQDTPQSVSIVTREKMDDFKLNSVNDMLSSTPGVTVESVETDRVYYTARGFDITNFQYDGVGLPFVFGNVTGNFDTALYEQVDVVRGANGLMSSTGNPSATVNFIRKRPTKDFTASSTLTFGSWGNKRIEADVSTPINDKWSARVVVARDQGDNWLDRYNLQKTVASVIVEGKLSANDKLSAGYTYQKSNSTAPMWGALPLYFTDGSPTNYASSASTSAPWAYQNAAVNSTFAEWSHDFGNGWSSKATATYNLSQTKSALFYVSGVQDRVTGLGLTSYPSYYASKFKQTLGDVSVAGHFDLGGRRHDLSFGGSWSESKVAENAAYSDDLGTSLPGNTAVDGSYPAPLFGAVESTASYIDKRRNVYAAVRWNLADAWHLLTGANLVKANSHGIDYGVNNYSSATRTTPYAGLVYTINPHLTAYGSYTAIFTPQSETDIDRHTLSPIEGKTYELGLKNALMGGKLNLSGALFKTEQNNTAQQAGYIGADAYYEGVNARSQGIELEMSGQLARNWQASLGLTQLSITGDDGKAARTYVPRRTLKSATTYRFDALPALKVGASLNLQSKIYLDDTVAVIHQGGYATLGLMAQYELTPKITLSANLNNVTDNRHLSSLYWSQSFYAAPRNGSVSINWKY